MKPPDRFRVAAIQMRSTTDYRKNLCRAEALVTQAAEDGAEAVLLPELFAVAGPPSAKRGLAEPIPGPLTRSLARWARTHGLYLVGGSVLERVCSSEGVHHYNTSVLFDPRGRLIACYRKIHLFDVDLPGGSSRHESELISPGQELQVISTGLGTFGLSICYDVRFPELYRRLVARGAQVIFLPAAFTLATGKDHWAILLRARAIENQVFLVAANQIGTDDAGQICWGKSMIVDPWGTVLAQAPESSDVVCTATIDLSYQRRLRGSFPCLNHRRLLP